VRKSLQVRLAADLDTAFPELLSSELDNVYTAVFRAGGQQVDVEDVAQETFLRAYSALQGYSTRRIRELKLRPWLLTIALNLWRNELRRRSRHPLASSDIGAPELRAEDGGALRLEAQADLDELVRILPDKYRVPVVLRHIVGLPLSEVADVMERPVGTVKAQVSRGLAMLRDHLEAERLEEAK
jgi:RNA polymerase sigma factor (sigma-70 family)